MQWNNPRTSYTQRDNPQSSSLRDNPRTSSPRCCTQRDNPRNSSPHRTNKDIPWASFPLRPTQTEGPRTSSPSRSKQSEVPWASIALRPTQGDRPPQTSSPTRPTLRDPPLSSSGSTRHNSPSPAASSSHNPGPHSASRTSSPLYPATCGAPQTSSEPSQPPCSVCIGHRDAPRASSPPRYLQHDPFPFFPDPHAPESESPHHNPPYIPPAVCIGHRDAPRASSPPRHTQFDPFPFLPDTSDAETQSPQHDPPQFPPPVCIGYRDAPRASSPPRQPPEPSLLFQDLPRASTESLVPSTDSLHEHPTCPPPVCIGHRDAPSFSSPPRQAPEPSLFFQDPPGTSMESLAPSTDSRHGSPMLPPQVCIGHRDAPRASSPPRHPPSDLALLAPSPPPGSSGGSRGSAAPGETRHNLDREEYTVLADLPPPRRLAQREPGPQCSNGGRTRSPGRAEVERLFGQERRKSEAPGAFQARDEGRSQRPSQGQNQLLRRQSSPALSREVTKPLAKQAEPARRRQAEPPHPRSPERQPEGDRQLQGSSLPPRTSARTPERERRTERPLESGRAGPRQPLGGWQSPEEPPGTQGPHRHLERGCGSLQEGPGLGGWQGLGEPHRGVAKAPEGTWRGPLRESEESWGQLGGPTGHRGQAEAWEEPPSNGLWESPDRSAQRGWGSLQDLPSAHQLRSPPENSRIDPAEFLKSQRPETPTTMGWGAEGTCPHLHSPERQRELDGRDLVGLLGAPREGAWARTEESTLTSHLPRLGWEGLLELLQAQLSRKDPAGHWGTPAPASGPEVGSPGTNGAPELERQGQPDSWEESTLVNGQSAGQWPQSSAQPPSPACIATQWPKTKVTSGPETSAKAGLEELGPLGSRSPAEGPSLPDWEFQSEEPEESEPSKGQDSLTDQKQADSADKRPAEGKAGSPLKGRLVTSWRMPGDRPTLFNPFLLSLGVLRWQRQGEVCGPGKQGQVWSVVRGPREERWRRPARDGPAPEAHRLGLEKGHRPGSGGSPGTKLASHPQEACERSLAEMESSHQQVMEGLQRHHERELQRLQQEKEWLLAEETAATASAIEAMKKAYQEELSRELSKTRSLPQGPDGLRKQHQSDVAALKRELQVLSEQYSQKCLEIGALTRQAEEREHTLRRCQQEGQELLRHNQELHTRLSEEIDRLRGFIASQGMGDGCGRGSQRSSCELEVLLRVKENELQYLKKEVQCLRDELQMLQKDKRFTSGKYQDVYVELNHIKTRSEREIEQLKEHLRLAVAALQEKEAMRNSLAE
ncbi:TRIO and F-actin-binding protein-like [Leptonychotes weddellii]|uniref:TRIO and F-actin-binding protein-like n=1 Tax=Leptonychotes weddellii TaxID=9713 RepID=A0A7F8Q9W5_LEPWE|nr:TRIO and F-actin-binding protein-like [Leptonychotes weddellii]